jgi:hypothetical protein
MKDHVKWVHRAYYIDPELARKDQELLEKILNPQRIPPENKNLK